MSTPLIQLEHITKTFPGVTANDDVSLSLWEGATHAVIGENGAGKSTLMGVLYGRYQPDSGRILHRGIEARIPNPAAAIRLGIGMVSQHTTMIRALSALENVILGSEPTAHAGLIDKEAAEGRVRTLAERLGIRIEWESDAGSLSVAALQKAEIVKALFRGARVLILDEPTATLAPQEAESLFDVMHSLTAEGATCVFVTHKLREVLAHSSRVSVLRAGKSVGELITSETHAEELLALMLGRTGASAGNDLTGQAASIGLPAWDPGHERGMGDVARSATGLGSTDSPSSELPALEVRELTVLNDKRAAAVKNVNLAVMPGEIVGVAGVDGSGQFEFAEAIVGLRLPESGLLFLDGCDITRMPVSSRQEAGIAYIPEDRLAQGLIMEFSVAENLLLGKQREKAFGGGRTLNLDRIASRGETVIREHRIRANGAQTTVDTLSGGNQQKVVAARALESRPRLMVAMQPTRGLDVEATKLFHSSMSRACADGMSILLFSLDLDELLALCSRIAVMFNGEMIGVVARATATHEKIGRMMVEGRA